MHTLDVTNEEKDLGIIVDNKLSFKAHINNSANKANRILGMIRRTFTHLDKDILNPLYKCLVRPHLEYASCVCSPAPQYRKDKLEDV